jgi:hypothetical protein
MKYTLNNTIERFHQKENPEEIAELFKKASSWEL